MAVGGNLAKLLFPTISADAERYLIIGGFAVLFYSLATVTNAILQGLNRLDKPVIHNLISLLVHVLLMFFFVYVLKLEITGVIIAYMLFGLVTTALNLWSIYKITGYLPEPMQSVLLPVGASFAVVLVCLLVSFYAMQALDFEKLLKKNRVMEARVLYALLVVSLAWLSAQFLLGFLYRLQG